MRSISVTPESDAYVKIQRTLAKLLMHQGAITTVHLGPIKPHLLKMGQLSFGIDFGQYDVVWENTHFHVVMSGTGPIYSGFGRAQHEKITITGPDFVTVKRFIGFLASHRKIKKEKVRLSLWSPKYEEWEEVGKRPPRTIDSVFIPKDIKDKIVTDVRTFVESESFYLKHGVTWKRNYLFSGPPGSGKTSLSMAIAHMIGYDISIIPFTTINDTSMVNAMQRLEDRQVVVLEDVDSLVQEKNDGLSVAGILNALDGIHTPNGLITIMTTNSPEKFSEAFIRPGRIDLHVLFSTATKETVVDALTHYDKTPTDELVSAMLDRCNSMAGIQHWLFRHRNDTELLKYMDELEEIGKLKQQKEVWQGMFN